MKILLIDPYLSPSREYGNLNKISNIIPNLGLGYIAACLEKENFKVIIKDCSIERIDPFKLIRIIKQEKPSVIGLTATVLSINSAVKTASIIKQEINDSIIFIGGPQVSAMPQGTMQKGCFDVGIIGEGEITVIELMKAIQNGRRDFSHIQGLIVKKNNAFMLTPERPCLPDIDQIPFPARHLFPPLSAYHYSPISTLKTPCAHLISSRGCPYKCKFCDKIVTGSVFRARSPDNVISEIKELIFKYNVRELKFFDDNFALNEERVYEICDLMDKKNIRILWSCIMHASNVNKDLFKRIKASGCWQVVFGLESGNQRILDSIHKSLTLEQSRRAVQWAREAGLNTRGSLIIGFPDETNQTVLDTINFVKEIKLDTPSFYIFSPYPGSQFFNELDNKGEIVHRDFDHYQLIIDPKTARLPFIPHEMSEKTLKDFINKCYKDVCLDPGYIISQLKQIKSFFQLRRYWRCLLALLDI